MRRLCLLLSVWFSASLFLMISGCKEKNNPLSAPNNQTLNKIEVGTSIEVSTTPVGTGGGSIHVVQPGTPVDGLEIIVPSNAYSLSKTFTVSYAEITSHQFGPNFHPVSPLVTIKNGGGYSSLPMTIVIPIKRTQGAFALGYLYNEAAGTLEALPLLAATDTSVTVTLSHCETSSLSLGKSIFQRKDNAIAQGNLIVSSISESILNSQSILNTGFQPGVDDWEFINYGSYIATGGHCAGQSMSAMWYYYEKKLKGSGGLFHKYDAVCDPFVPGTLWQDNSWGYRFASTIQEDFQWGDWMLKVNLESYIPSLVWKSFIAAMLVTGEPQFVIIKNSASGVGHAMIVYKINVSEGKLYIADPNYPNNRAPDGISSVRTINYTGGIFEPYPSAINANASPLNFDQIAFFGKTANINWSQIGIRWTEFQNKIVGNDRFPAYDLFVDGDSPVPLTDGFILNQDTLKVYCRSTAASQYLLNSDHLQAVYIYDVNGNIVTQYAISGSDLGIARLLLSPGKNKLGFYIQCAKDNKWNYADFKWITVVKFGITSISPSHGVEGTAVSISGGGFRPTQGTSYVQFNGVSTTSVSSWSDTLIVLRVPQNCTSGEITVVVDGKTSNGKLFTIDTSPTPNGLDQMTKVQVMIDGTTIIGQQNNITTVSIENTDGFSSAGSSAYSECPLVWSGTNFFVNGVHVRSTYQRDSVYISGTVSADGGTLLSVRVAYRYYMISSTDGTLEDEETFGYTLTNVPRYMSNSYLVFGSGAGPKISDFTWRRWTKGLGERFGSFTSVNIVAVNFE